jgi:acetyl esterase/lipase
MLGPSRSRSGRCWLTLAMISAACAVHEPAQSNNETSMDIALWPGQKSPAMSVSFPPGQMRANRPAMVVFRGGAYATSSGSGAGSGEWLAKQGIVGAVVPYRVESAGGGAYPACYADAARAVRLLRSRATELGVDPHRIGVLGYSAGGHLASLLSTQPNLFADPADDLAASVSARPDLAVLAYPLISFVDGYAPGAFVGSTENFFGYSAVAQEQRRAFSNELHVGPNHPPVFIWTTRDDALVPYTHSQLFADAAKKAGVSVQFELYPNGPHGLGLALGRADETGQWTTHLLSWLTTQWNLPPPR